MSDFEALFEPLSIPRDLEASEAAAVMEFLIGGAAAEDEILAILNVLCDKEPTQTELVAFAQVMQAKALRLTHDVPLVVDTCGTGGGASTFNISTAAALVAAGAGAKIAKHGNRSSSGIGSADVLEAAGVRLNGSTELLRHQLETVGIVFLFAPNHHPAMKHVASARKRLGRRSVFNLLGPLANPAGATRLSIGVYDRQFLPLMAEAARDLGIEKGVFSHSEDGLDEISPCAPTHSLILAEGALQSITIEPCTFNIRPIDPAEIEAGKTIEEARHKLMEAIEDIRSPRAKAVVPSAAVAIWLADLAPDFESAARLAEASIEGGWARRKLNHLIELGAAS